MRTLLAFLTGISLLGLALPHAMARDGGSPYYANNVDKAVRDATRNPTNQAYVGNTWYNRTTSKSFNLPKLMNKEMGLEVIDGALDSTAAGPNDPAPTRTSPLQLSETDVGQREAQKENAGQTNTQLSDDEDEDELKSKKKLHIKKVEYKSESYTGEVHNIRADVEIKAFVRP